MNNTNSDFKKDKSERPALQDKPYLMAFFADKSIKEIEAMFRQEPSIEAPSNSKK